MLDVKAFTNAMKLSDFDYELPPGLIADNPLAQRSASKLLHYKRESKTIENRVFQDLPALLKPNDLLIFNDTKVLSARLFGNKTTGGKIECLVTSFNGKMAHCFLKGKNLNIGQTINFTETIEAKITDINADERTLEFNQDVALVLDSIGEIPIPPYFKRTSNHNDQTRYQTVYAKNPGAIAAPTAGLHFDDNIFQALATKNIDTSFLTLHVGAGTFKPVQTEDINAHKMHSEQFIIPNECIAKIKRCRQNSGRVIAVGTTVVRALETMMQTHNEPKAYMDASAIFITPGFKFKCVDALITNFHLPKSTLLMLISAFVGHENMQKCYAHAISNQYRFYSYGDAMLIT